MKKILSADVGGTFIKFAVMNDAANFFERGKIETPKTNYEEFLKVLVELCKKSEVEGIAISLPGIIDSKCGFCVTSGALTYNSGKFIAADLEKICGVKVTLENDANCAALAEARIGNLADVEDGFVMVFGTMIGGAFIKNHEVHRGKNNLSGEVSFMFDDIGKKFFWQNCSVPALLKNFSNKITGEEFFKSVELGNENAIKILKNFTRQVAVQLFNIQMILDPEKFAIGGGISEQKIFIEYLRESLEEVYSECFIKFPHVKIVPCKFHNDANLIGALFRWLK